MRIPTYDNFQVAPNTLPQPRFDAPNMPDVAGQQMQQMGAGMQKFGADIGAEADRQQAIVDQVRVNDALNQAKEFSLRITHDKDIGFTNIKGNNALNRPRELADEYGDMLQTQINTLAGSLGSDRQKQMFAAAAGNIVSGLRGQAIRHTADEFKSHALSVADGVQATAVRDIALNYRNPEMLEKAVLRIEAETYRQGQLLGKSAEWQEAHARKMTSNGFKVAMLSALEQNDPTTADALLKKYSGRMDADDIVSVRTHITKEMNQQVAVGAANTVMEKLNSQFNPGDGERAFNILLGTESNNRQFNKDGSVVTSVKGAIGIAQVMPTTAPEAAKLAGLPWDEVRYKTDPAYNKALGLAYFQKQLQTFGDIQLAWAAYNAGPNAVHSALKRAKRDATLAATDASTTVAKSWLEYLPRETQDYVTKNSKAFNAGGGRVQKPTIADALNELKADPAIGNNPDRLKLAASALEHQFAITEKARKQREDESVASVQAALIENGGNFAALPQPLRANIPPGKYDDVITFAGKISSGQAVSTDWGLYYSLKNDPQVLQEVNLMAMRDKLGNTEFKHLIEEQQELRTGKKTSATNLRTTKDVVNQMMRESGIDPTPSDNNKEGAAKVGRIWAELETRVRDREQEVGRKLTTDEIQKEAARMLANVEVVRSWMWNTTKKPGEIQANERVKVPDAEKARIAALLKKHNKPADDAAIENVYRRSLGIQAFKE